MCVFYDGNSRRLNQKWFYGEAGNRACDLWFTRHRAYPLHHGGFFPTKIGFKLILCFCGRVPWLYQYWPGGFILFVVLCSGTPKGSTGSGSGFKASQKTGQRLKVSSDRLGEAGNRTCDPWFTRHQTNS